MSVTLIEAGLFALLDSPVGPVSRHIEVRADAVAYLARQNVQTLFHTRTGNLQQSIGTFPTETPDGLNVEVGTEGAPYGRVLEVGGEPHLILPVNRESMFSEPDNPTPLWRSQRIVMHPGPAARPWLVPALEQVFGA